jgi:hypothetical protein
MANVSVYAEISEWHESAKDVFLTQVCGDVFDPSNRILIVPIQRTKKRVVFRVDRPGLYELRGPELQEFFVVSRTAHGLEIQPMDPVRAIRHARNAA